MQLLIDAEIGLLALMTLAALQPVVLPDLAARTVAEGINSGISESRQVTVRTLQEWRTLWSAHSSEPAPQVDFSRSLAVGVFLGSRPTAGFRVEITRVTIEGDRAVVQFVERRPEPDAILGQVITAPFHVVTLPSVVRTITFQQLAPRR